MMEKKSNRGGARKGAGRKPIVKGGGVHAYITLTPEQKEKLKALGGSRWVARMLDCSDDSDNFAIHAGNQDKGIMLSEAIAQMKNAICSRDLSDELLLEEDNTNWTRYQAFCGEWCHGITMVPCTFALQLAKEVLKTKGDCFVFFEEEK